MRSWLLYFFTGFWSNRRSAECQWRSLGNTALGALLSFLILVCCLTWGYQASFVPTYQNAGQFRQFLYSAMDSIDFTVKDGIASGESRVNTYESARDGYRLIVDLRDTRHIYDDFTLTCSAEDGRTLSYESYLAQPAHIQNEYTVFTVEYTGRELDLEKKCPEYLAYLQTVTDPESLLYQEEIAGDLKKLEDEKPADYYEQVYLLYVSAYYPELQTAEFNTQAPTLHGYYLDLMSRDTDGKFLCLLKEQCYVGFHSGERQIVYTGNYSGIASLEQGSAGADELIRSTFQSSSQTDYLMYAVNVFGGFFLIILLWLVLMLVARGVSRLRRLEAAQTFSGAAQLVGSFLLWSGALAGVSGFALSFLLDQAAVYYLAVAIMALCLTARTTVFLCAPESAHP